MVTLIKCIISTLFPRIHSIHCQGLKEKFSIIENVAHFFIVFLIYFWELLQKTESFFFKDYFETKLI